MTDPRPPATFKEKCIIYGMMGLGLIFMVLYFIVLGPIILAEKLLRYLGIEK